MSIKIQANPSASGSTPTGGLTYKGSYDAALQTPNLDSSLKGDFYIVSDAGSLDGVALNVGDHIVFNQDASSPITSAMFDVIDNTDAVASVNGETGVVVLNLKTINDVNATLTPSDSTFLVGDGSEWIGESGATARTSLGLSIGSDVQAHDAQLDDVAGLTPADGAFIVGDGSNFVTETLGTARNSLGLGTVATLDVGNGANQVVQMTAAAKLPAVDGSLLTNLPSGGDLLASNNLSDLDNAGTARTNLGLAIGTNVQAFDAQLTDVAGLTPTDGNIIIGDGSNFVTESGATARTSLGLSIGSDVQAFDAQLTDVAGLTPTDGNIIIGDGSNFITESGATARTSLGLSIGSDVQAFDAQLTDIAGLTPTDSNFIVGDGSNFILESGLTARTSLGCGSAATFDAGANSANQLVQLTAAAKLPAVDGSLLTNLPGGGDLLAANNLSDLDNAGTARTNLGLAIGSDVQAFDAQLTDVAGLTPTDSNFIVGDGSNFITESGATARTSLGLAIGSDVQAFDAQLTDVAGLTPADGAFIVGDGSNFVTETLGTARNSLGLGTVATLDVGNGANQIVQMTAAAKLPAVDGSLLTNLPSGGASTPDTTTVSQGTDYTISTSTGIEEAFFITPTADINVNLPSAVTVGEGYKYNIKNLASGFSLTVDADGTQTIDASLTYVINNQ
ncbi:MAG: beta strand repeat-containing protein, partial [Planctomycetota bacterium]